MIFTSLQLFDVGIWEQSWYFDVNTNSQETPLNSLKFQSNTITNLATPFYENPGLLPKNLEVELSTDFIGKNECESIERVLWEPNS